MPIKLNLWEKCYIIALFGDVDRAARERMFSVSKFPAQCGPAVMREGYEFIASMSRDRVAVKAPRRNQQAIAAAKAALMEKIYGADEPPRPS